MHCLYIKEYKLYALQIRAIQSLSILSLFFLFSLESMTCFSQKKQVQFPAFFENFSNPLSS